MLRTVLLTLALVLAVVPLAGAQASETSVDYASYHGGSLYDEASAIEVGPDGSVYVTGITESTDFPGASGTRGDWDAYVSKLTADGTLLWTRAFGGSDVELPTALAVTADAVFVAGETHSSDLPVRGTIVYDSTGANGDGFLGRLDVGTGAIEWLTYFGGSSFDTIADIEMEPQGRVVVGGSTSSCDFPSWDEAYRSRPAGCTMADRDAFVARFWADGALNRVTLFGGSDTDLLGGIAVSQSSGSVILAGTTWSSDLPTTSSSLQQNGGLAAGSVDAYVAKLDDGLRTLSWATYLGGSDEWDSALGVARDAAGNAYVAGYTYATDFPTTSGANQRTHASPTGCFDGIDDGPCPDAFVAKVDAAGSALVWSTLHGGAGMDVAMAIDVGADAVARATGFTSSDGSDGTGGDAFLLSTADGASVARVLLAGAGADEGYDVDVGGGSVWLAGGTDSADFPVTSDARDATYNGDGDGWVARLDTQTPVPGVTFDHKGGNEWWVQVAVSGEPAAVEAMEEGGTWHTLTKRWWGDWAASFHIEPGERVIFRAFVEGTWVTSCWFTHPDGVEQCEGGGAFEASFHGVKGNEWWLETRVTANEPLAGVSVSINGGSPRALMLRDWGSWAASHHAPTGSIVRFIATSAHGDTATSGCYQWPSADLVSCEGAAPTFDHKGGNEWWVEVVISGAVPTRVEAMDDDGAWHALTLRDWGAWAASFHIEPGHDVRFRAEVNGAWWTSCWFTHPDGVAHTGGGTCVGTR